MQKLNTIQLGEGGRHLIMLHGWGRSLYSLKNLGELLSQKWHVHLIDLPGFGDSPMPDGVWGADKYADRIVQYMDEAGVPKASFLGHSFGGKISMQIAVKYPTRVDQLILMGASGLKRKKTFKIKMISFLGKTIKFLDRSNKIYKNWFAKKFGSSDYKNAGKMRPILVKAVNEQISNLENIQAKTLILWGADDTETPLEIGKKLDKLIESSKLLVFPDKDHNLFHDTGSHLCAVKILEEFDD